MIKIRILSVGKKSSRCISELIADYQNRMSSQAQISWQLLPTFSASTPLQQCQKESTQLLKLLKPDDYVVLLDARGQIYDNQELAEKIRSCQINRSFNGIVFIIGGAHGVNHQILGKRVNVVWSLSKLVFPHELVRLLLIEQLYRSFSILNNHPYHHA